MSARVCFVVGARPNFMKSAPVYRELSALDPSLELVLLHTGQHYDDCDVRRLLPRARDAAAGRVPRRRLRNARRADGEGAGRDRAGAARARDPTSVVVAGDVNSTLAGALAAVKLGRAARPHRGRPAQLRPFRCPKSTTACSPTTSATSCSRTRKRRSSTSRGRGSTSGVHLVGNTMIDSLLEHVDTARARRSWEQFGFEPGGYALSRYTGPRSSTIRRSWRRSTDGLIALAATLPVVFPVHPRTLGSLQASRRRSSSRRRRSVRERRHSATSTFSAWRPTPLSSSRTRAASRRRRRRSASAASRSATRPSGASRRSSARTPSSVPGRSGLAEIPQLLERPKPGEAIPRLGRQRRRPCCRRAAGGTGTVSR